MEEARARGVDVTIDQYPYTASSTGTASLIPQEYQEGGQKALVERLGAPQQRTRIKLAIIERIKFDRGGGDPANIVMANCSWDKSLDGKNLAEITKMRGREVDLRERRRNSDGDPAFRRLLGHLPRHLLRRTSSGF